MSSSDNEQYTDEVYTSDDDDLDMDWDFYAGNLLALGNTKRNLNDYWKVDCEAYQRWVSTELNDFDVTDTDWLEQQGRLLWCEKANDTRTEYRTKLGVALRDANLPVHFYNAGRIGRHTKGVWMQIPVASGFLWFMDLDRCLTGIIHETMPLKWQKLTDFFWNMRGLLRDANNEVGANFDAFANHCTELVQSDDWQGVRLRSNENLLQLLRLANSSANYQLASMFNPDVLDTTGSATWTSVTLHDGTVHLRGTEHHPKYMSISSWKYIDAVVTYPVHKQTKERMLFGYDDITCKLVDDLYNALDELDLNQDNSRVTNAKHAITRYRSWVQNGTTIIGFVLDAFFPLSGKHESHERVSLSPYARRFSPVGDLDYNKGLFVYPRALDIPAVYTDDWAPGIKFEFLRGFAENVVGGWAITSGLREVRRCASVWQAIVADGNFLFEPHDWCWDLVLPAPIFQSIFGIDRCRPDSAYPCSELADGSDNWYFTIMDLLDGVRSVQCDWCNKITNAPNSRILCHVQNIEEGTLLNYTVHFLSVITGMTTENVYRLFPTVAKCDQSYNYCNHWFCEGLEFGVHRLQSIPIGRVCGGCLEKDWIYCADFNMQVSASDGFGFFHQRRSTKGTKPAKKCESIN